MDTFLSIIDLPFSILLILFILILFVALFLRKGSKQMKFFQSLSDNISEAWILWMYVSGAVILILMIIKFLRGKGLS